MCLGTLSCKYASNPGMSTKSKMETQSLQRQLFSFFSPFLGEKVGSERESALMIPSLFLSCLFPFHFRKRDFYCANETQAVFFLFYGIYAENGLKEK